MLKRKRRKIGRAKCFLSAKFFIIAIILAGFSAVAGGYRIIYEKKSAPSGGQAASIGERAAAFPNPADFSPPISLAAAMASSSPRAATYQLNLQNDIAVYVLSKKSGPCNDYRNSVLPGIFSMRCKTASSIWRGTWVKKIDTAGYSRLRIKAHLDVNDYTDYFAECGHKGTNRDNFVDLIVLSHDPRPELNAQCNHVVKEKQWPECSVDSRDRFAVTHCGIPRCSSSASCDMEINTKGREAAYLLFTVTDAWVADIEGELTGVEIALTK